VKKDARPVYTLADRTKEKGKKEILGKKKKKREKAASHSHPPKRRREKVGASRKGEKRRGP